MHNSRLLRHKFYLYSNYDKRIEVEHALLPKMIKIHTYREQILEFMSQIHSITYFLNSQYFHTKHQESKIFDFMFVFYLTANK